MNKKGIALIVAFMVIVVLAILGSATISRSVSERFIAQRYAESTQAFWLAEAGVNRALKELKSNYTIVGNGLWSTPLGGGRYQIDVSNVTVSGQTYKKVTAHGIIPLTGPARAERVVETLMSKFIPPNFYDNAVYSAGEVDFNGNAFSVSNNLPAPDNKAIIYSGEFDVQHPERITGTITQDTTISPLALLDFQQLLSISQGQGNVYDSARLERVKQGQESFPASFWYAPGVPNVVYVEEDLTLKGNIGTIGGFYVVVGDVITNPTGVFDATINGDGQIEGAIYTRGEFKVNGGGGGLNVNGGVWSGEEIDLNGNSHITYNQSYMNTIKALNINPDVQINSWRDAQNPYTFAS